MGRNKAYTWFNDWLTRQNGTRTAQSLPTDGELLPELAERRAGERHAAGPQVSVLDTGWRCYQPVVPLLARDCRPSRLRYVHQRPATRRTVRVWDVLRIGIAVDPLVGGILETILLTLNTIVINWSKKWLRKNLSVMRFGRRCCSTLIRARINRTTKSGQQWLTPSVSTDWNQPPRQRPQTGFLIGFRGILSRVKTRTEIAIDSKT